MGDAKARGSVSNSSTCLAALLNINSGTCEIQIETMKLTFLD